MALAVMSEALMAKTPVQQNPDQTTQQEDDNSFAAVATLLDFFDGAQAAKADVDSALNKCAHMQHLRDAITSKRGTKHEATGLCYLERYIFLILFAAYVREQARGSDKEPLAPVISEEGFERWITNHKDRSHIYNLVDHMTLDAP